MTPSPAPGPKRRLAFLLATCLLLAACGDGGEPETRADEPPTVTVAEPVARTITEWDRFTGRLEAVDAVEVRARVSGYLQAVHFEEGALVDEGDLLYEIDPRPYQAVLEEAEAQVHRARVRLELAESELDRARRLYERRAISEEELDARSQEQKEAMAALAAAEAEVEAARLDVEFTRVRAPISGRISNTRVTRGNLIRGGSADSTLLTTLVSMDPIYFYFSADERAVLRYMRWIAAGERPSARERTTEAYLQLADEEGFPHRGLIDFVDNRIDDATGTLRVRAVFDNADHLLVPGMFGKITVPGRGPYEAVLIPPEAVGTDQAEQFVYVVDEDDVARRRVVELGPDAWGLRVVRRGVQPGERLVVEGIQRVTPDEAVTPEPTELEPDESDAPGPDSRPQHHPDRRSGRP